MFGVKKNSTIYRIRQPEFTIGRFVSNTLIINSSLKVSRSHAVITIIDNTPFIKDINSEWGVFIDGTKIPKNRRVELQVGDKIGIGIPVDGSNNYLEIVNLEPDTDGGVNDVNEAATQAAADSTPPSDAPKFETIDITSHEDVIEIDDEEESDDEIEFLPPPQAPQALPAPQAPSAPPAEVNMKVVPSDEQKAAPNQNEAILRDVTPTMNGLLKPCIDLSDPPEPPLVKPIDNIDDQLAAVFGTDMPPPLETKTVFTKLPNIKKEYEFSSTQELHNALNYSMHDEIISLDSDEEDFPSSQLNTTNVQDVPDYSSAFGMIYELKSELSDDEDDVILHSSWYESLTQNLEDVKVESPKELRKSKPDDYDFVESPPTESVESLDDVDMTESSSASNEPTCSTPVIEPVSSSRDQEASKTEKPVHSRIPKIPIIEPLPRKRTKRKSTDINEIFKKRHREKSESPETIHRRVADVERHVKSSPSTSSKSSRRHRLHRSTNKLSSSEKEERKQKLRALSSKSTAENDKLQKKTIKEAEIKPKVKITDKNRGSFLTEMPTAVSVPSKLHTSNEFKPTKPDVIVKEAKQSHDKREIDVVPAKNKISTHSKPKNGTSVTSSKSHRAELPSSSTVFSKLDISVGSAKSHHSAPPSRSPNLETSNSSRIQRLESPSSSISKVEPKPYTKPILKTFDKIKFNKIEGNVTSKKKVVFTGKIDCLEIEKNKGAHEFSSWKKYENLIKNCQIEFDNALCVILSWNVKWLQEQQKQTTPPPLYSIAYQNGNVPDMVDKYKEELKRSLFYRIWKNIFGAWNVKNNDDFPQTQDPGLEQRNHHVLLIEKVDNSRSDSLFTIYAKCEVPPSVIHANNKEKDLITNGKLTILSFRITKPASNVEVKTMAFAYVASCNRFVEGSKHVDKIILKIYSKPFSIVCGRAKLKVLSYTKTLLRQFQVLGMSKQSSIIKPLTDMSYLDRFDMEKMTVIHDQLKNQKFLDSSQKRAIAALMCCISQDTSVTFVNGPSGTGKTQVIVSLIQELSCMDNVPKILIVTWNDKAADDLVYRISKDEKVKNLIKFGDESGLHSNVRSQCGFNENMKRIIQIKGDDLVNVVEEVNYLRARINQNKLLLGSPKYKTSESEILSRLKGFQAEIDDMAKENSNVIKNLKQQLAKNEVIESANIVVASLSSCWSSAFESYFVPTSFNKGDIRSFEICIFDDANLYDENDLLIPQMLQVRHLMMVGDQKVKRHPNSPYHKILYHYSTNNESYVSNLDTDHRIHPDVSPWLREYYKLAPSKALACRRSKLKPFVVIDYDSNHVSDYEAPLCEKLIKVITETDTGDKMNVSVLVSSNSRKESLKLAVESNINKHRILIDMFDGFWAREQDIVILCLPCSKIFDEWLYIASTRAKSGLFICGDFGKIERVPLIESLLNHSKSRKLYFSLRNDPLHVPLEKLKNFMTL